MAAAAVAGATEQCSSNEAVFKRPTRRSTAKVGKKREDRRTGRVRVGRSRGRSGTERDERGRKRGSSGRSWKKGTARRGLLLERTRRRTGLRMSRVENGSAPPVAVCVARCPRLFGGGSRTAESPGTFTRGRHLCLCHNATSATLRDTARQEGDTRTTQSAAGNPARLSTVPCPGKPPTAAARRSEPRTELRRTLYNTILPSLPKYLQQGYMPPQKS